MQMQTDTNISLNLSSGLDSKLMLSCVDKINGGQKKIRANSFFFENKNFNEKPDLEAFAKFKNWKVNFFQINAEDVKNYFDETLFANDGPFPGVPTISKNLLIKRSSISSYKVVLEGQGGDDIAGGYKYVFGYFLKDLIKSGYLKNFFIEIFNFSRIEKINLFKVFGLLFNSFKSLNDGGVSADGSKSIFLDVLDRDFLNKNNIVTNNFLEDIKNISGDLKKVIYRDLFYTKLQRILKSCDRVSMINGKELRVPLLDHRIVDFFFNLENNQMIRNGNLRFFYRKVAGKLMGNHHEFIKKKYVIDPQSVWLKNELYEWAYFILENNKTKHDGIFNTKKLLIYLEKFKKDEKMNNSNLIWQALCIRRMQQIF
jgi:asparagine synthase (glutamine-hydrolysing)